VREELGDFRYEMSAANASIVRFFGRTLRLNELKGIFGAISYWLRQREGIQLPKPSRNAKRNYSLLVKYIERHYDVIVPMFSKVELCDAERNPIPLLDATIQLGS
jgi:hypothetical protein